MDECVHGYVFERSVYSRNVSHAHPRLSQLLCSVQRATSINHIIKITSAAPGWLVHYPGRLNSIRSRPRFDKQLTQQQHNPGLANTNSSSTVVLAGVWDSEEFCFITRRKESIRGVNKRLFEVFALLRVSPINCRYLWEVYDLFGESKLLAAYVTIILHAWLQSTDFL